MLLFEHLNTPTVKPIIESSEDENSTRNNTQKTHLEKLATIPCSELSYMPNIISVDLIQYHPLKIQ